MENLPEDHTEIQEKQPVLLPEQLQQILQNNWRQIGFLGTVVLFLATVGVFGFYVSKTRKGEGLPQLPQVSSPTPVETILPSPGQIVPTPTLGQEKSLTKGAIFYIEGKNIFMSDKFGKNKVQITNHSETDVGGPQNVQVIDGDYLGYFKCDTAAGDFNCGIYRVNVVTKQTQRLLQEDKDKLILQLAWHDKDTFVYTVSGEPVEYWWIYLYRDGEKVLIEEIKGEPYGRGGFIEDSVKLSFSPDGTKILHISTSSPRSGEDFNVYIFDTSGVQLTKIGNATQPAWSDDQTIVYRRYPGGGTYLFDLDTKKEEKLVGISDNAYNPKILRGTRKLAYWVNEGNGQVWVADLAERRNNKLLDNASDPLWVTEEEVLVQDNRACTPEEPCMQGFISVGASLVNILTRTKTKVFEREDGGNIFDDTTFYSSHWSD